jgi:hypothetical protein
MLEQPNQPQQPRQANDAQQLRVYTHVDVVAAV